MCEHQTKKCIVGQRRVITQVDPGFATESNGKNALPSYQTHLAISVPSPPFLSCLALPSITYLVSYNDLQKCDSCVHWLDCCRSREAFPDQVRVQPLMAGCWVSLLESPALSACCLFLNPKMVNKCFYIGQSTFHQSIRRLTNGSIDHEADFPPVSLSVLASPGVGPVSTRAPAGGCVAVGLLEQVASALSLDSCRATNSPSGTRARV